MSKTFILLVLLSFDLCIASSIKDDILVFDSKIHFGLPAKFRSTDKSFVVNKLISSEQDFAIRGLDRLRASASAQFSRFSLEEMVNYLRAKTNMSHLYVLDLRYERHAFIDGFAVSFLHNNNHEIKRRYSHYFYNLEVFVYSDELKKNPQLAIEPAAFVDPIFTDEGEETSALGLKYMRMPVVDAHPPGYEQILAFANFVRSLPEESWLHIHCRGGKARSTTFMVILDIVKNPELSFEEIIKRQFLLGGKNLSKKSKVGDSQKNEKDRLKADRLDLLRRFYRENSGMK